MLLAFDFDDTIVHTEWPHIKDMRKDKDGYSAKECINELFDDGHQIIIWTCREGIYAEEAEKFLKQLEIKYHRFNKNCPERIAFFNSDPRKIGADLYIDDKGILGIPSFRAIKSIIDYKALTYIE
jgi:hypothetical protein